MAYRVAVIQKSNRPAVNSGGAARHDTWVDYDGVAYSCIVPNGIIYVRRNGKPVWSGASHMDQLTPAQVAERLQGDAAHRLRMDACGKAHSAEARAVMARTAGGRGCVLGKWPLSGTGKGAG